MYKALTSFAMNKKDYEEMDIRKGQILPSDFASEEIIDDLLESNLIEEYDGSIEITENGIYNVTEYETADVNVSGGTPTLQSKEVSITENGTTNVSADTGYDGLSGVEITTNVDPDLETKSVTITENTTTTITPTQGKDGLSSVEVITNVSGGADLSDYYSSTIQHSQIGTYVPSGIVGSIKKVPPLTLSGTNASTLFGYMTSLTTSPEIDLTGATDLSSLFFRCTNLQEINNVIFPSSFGAGALNMSSAFQYCTNLSGDLSSVNLYSQTFQYTFNGCEHMTVSPTIHLRSGAYANLYGMFIDCTALTTIPNIEYNNYIQSMGMFCYNCTNLVNVPPINSSFINASGLVDSFKNCPNLSNDSLNNILSMCTSATGVSSTNKTLAKVGLSQAQATICEGLSNYQAFINAGWTTGY